MWEFQGNYTGKAKAYIQEMAKKETKIGSLISTIVIAILFTIIAIVIGDGNRIYVTIILSAGLAAIILVHIILFACYKREPKCEIKITNDGFHVYDVNRYVSFAFYKIQTIEEHDDFIVVKDLFNKAGYILQKELLIEGKWEDLKVFLKKVEDSLDSDDSIYQIEEPTTEFFEATVKSKRIYEQFVNGVSVTTPVGLFHYFATFILENGEDVEYEISQDWYEKIEKEQSGILVTINGKFFSFGEGEDIE